MKDLSLAYAMKKKAAKCAHGGEMHCNRGCFAEGGEVDRKALNAGEYKADGSRAHDRQKENAGGYKAADSYSKGGAVKGVHEAFDGAHDMNSKGGQSFAGDRARWASSIEAKGTKAKYGEAAKLEHKKILEELRSMKAPNLMAKGGEAFDEKKLKSEGYHEGWYGAPPKHNFPKDKDAMHPMIAKLLAKRGYSEGGQVANDVEPIADGMPANFDDLALRDDLEFSYTGENSGDELGNEQLEHDEKDIVARIMRSRAKKDRMPRPA